MIPRDEIVKYLELSSDPFYRMAANDLRSLTAENAALRRELDSRLCASCLERHPYGTMCPPHEMRTTGQEWFRERMKEWEAENAALRKRLEIAEACLSHYADHSLWERWAYDSWKQHRDGYKTAELALKKIEEVQ